uniref:Uncharacterized protein n=1 Tax=Arundo donax TaxID=35708 RepID=A0A0A9H6U5_ARUDO
MGWRRGGLVPKDGGASGCRRRHGGGSGWSARERRRASLEARPRRAEGEGAAV